MHGTLPVRSTYKTPLELGFSQEEFDALAWFVDEYDAGRIEDADPTLLYTLDDDFLFYNTDVPSKFYMPKLNTRHGCETAGCILGWVRHRVGGRLFCSNFWPQPIHALFTRRYDAKAAQARDATVRVLRGEPAWS